MIIAQLPTPIQAFGKLITEVSWRVNYPENLLYYILNTSEGVFIKDGNWNVPTEVVNTWCVDDSVVSNALISAEPWNN
jgi:hypothetical protein